jgi:hypothetical protein
MRILEAIIRTTNLVSSLTNFICFKKMDKCLAKSSAIGFCFLEALIKLNSSFKV